MRAGRQWTSLDVLDGSPGPDTKSHSKLLKVPEFSRRFA